MRFVLIRHAQSGNNLLVSTGSDTGHEPDTLLTPHGQEQAAALASYATEPGLGWSLTHLRCSLMARTIQTAAPIAEALDLPLVADDDLHECLGPYDVHAETGERVPHPGSSRSALAALSPRLVLPEVATEEGWWRADELEEGDHRYAERARLAVARLREELPEDATVGVVTHGWFTQYLLRELLGIGEMDGWLTIRNTAVSMLAEAREPWTRVQALRIGWTPHLSDAQLTV